MKYFNVILYSRDGCEIASSEVEGKANAKKHAKYMLSDEFARQSETTHAAFQTMKVAIFAEGEETGANNMCEWDAFHPQHAVWERERNQEDLGGVIETHLDALSIPRTNES